MNTLAERAKHHLSPEAVARLRRLRDLVRRGGAALHEGYLRLWHRRDLNRLAVFYGTDKWGAHYYTQHYVTHFEPYRHRKLNVLEIGIGGYRDVRAGGESLRMWRTYFPRAIIHGLDIHDKSYHRERRIHTYQGSQNDPAFLNQVAADIGRLDIIIDDGSHISEHVITSFKTLFPLLEKGGLYVIEDTQTSYWPDWKGDAHDRNTPRTSMGFLKALVDGLNYEEFPDKTYEPTYFDRHITSIHFYHNLVFIYKGDNAEGSNRYGRRVQPSA